MARTTAADGLKVQKWDDQFFKQYIQENPFKAYMGTGTNSVIQLREDKVKRYQKITFSLVNRLTNNAVTGSDTLEGNEEQMDQRSFTIDVDKRRNGVETTEIEEQYSAIALRDAKRDMLMDWAMEDTRDRVIEALGSINGVPYASATAAQKNAWTVDNADRVLFGEAAGNYSATHSTALSNITTASGKLDTGILGLMKRMAGAANPKIRPMRVANLNRRFYVAFVHPLAMRDLKADTTLSGALSSVSIAKENNRLFQGGDIDWDGVIVHEVDDMPIYSGVGDGGSDVSPVYLVGQQAIGYAIAQRWNTKTNVRDYEDKHGLAVQEIGGIAKMTFGSGSGDTDDLKDHGVLTAFVSTTADA